MKIKNLTSKSGFTLIELIFVIAIIGVIAAAGMSMIQKQAQEAKVEKSAIQIQQILHAAIEYYNDNKCWPTDPACKSKPDFQGQYVPVMDKIANEYINPWGNTITYSLYAPSGAPVEFQVSTKAPTKEIAQRIKGMLPNAVLDAADNTVVKVQMMYPQQMSGAQSVYLVAAGSITFDHQDRNKAYTKISGFSCPPSDISEIYFDTIGFSATQNGSAGNVYPYILIETPTISVDGGCKAGACIPYEVTIYLTGTGKNIFIGYDTDEIGTGGVTDVWAASDSGRTRYFTNYRANYSIYCKS